MKLPLLSLAASIALATSLQAQATSIFVPDNSASTGGANVIPFGNSKTSTTWANQIYQALVPTSYAGSGPVQIRDLGFAPSSTNVHNFDTIKVTLGLTTSATMSATFASNIMVRPQVVLDAKDYTMNLTADTWTRIGLQKPYTWIPTLGNLVVQIEVTGTGGVGQNTGGFRRSSTIERKYAFGWTGTPPATGNTGSSLAALKMELVVTAADASVFGAGCRGSNGVPTMSYSSLPVPGQTLTANVASARANSVAVSVLGFSNSAPLPVDLTAAGAPGCFLYTSLDIVGSVATGTNGNFSVALPIPNDQALVGSIFYQQFFVFDPTVNALQLVGSNYGRALIGN